MREIYICKSLRLCRFLYSLGFDKQPEFDEEQNEYWVFERSPELKEALDFFFYMRKTLKERRIAKGRNYI